MWMQILYDEIMAESKYDRNGEFLHKVDGLSLVKGDGNGIMEGKKLFNI